MIENGGLVTELEIANTLTEIRVKLDVLVNRDTDQETRLRTVEKFGDPTERIADLEQRLRAVEKWQWRLTGAVIAAGALGGGAGAGVASLLGGG